MNHNGLAITILLFLCSVFAQGQNPTGSKSTIPPTPPQDSIAYRIKIVPHDTTRDERMPTYKRGDFV